MAPFWSGMAIGIAIGIPIFLLCVFAGLVLAIYCAIDQGVRGGEFAAAWRRGKIRSAEIRARGEARRQRDLAWMERHWATRWCAHLNRRLLG
jgi:hypothetical protein